jgi:hypothetical protein
VLQYIIFKRWTFNQNILLLFFVGVSVFKTQKYIKNLVSLLFRRLRNLSQLFKRCFIGKNIFTSKQKKKKLDSVSNKKKKFLRDHDYPHPSISYVLYSAAFGCYFIFILYYLSLFILDLKTRLTILLNLEILFLCFLVENKKSRCF